MLFGLFPKIQWAAVTTEVELRRAPPQKGIVEKRLGQLCIALNVIADYLTSPTCQGNSLRTASFPPTILVPVLRSPHAQLVLVGVAAVVVVSGGLVTSCRGLQHPRVKEGRQKTTPKTLLSRRPFFWLLLFGKKINFAKNDKTNFRKSLLQWYLPSFSI